MPPADTPEHPHLTRFAVPLAITLLLTTMPDARAARALAQAALEARVAACVTQQPVHSRYHWQAGIEAADEIQLLFKTGNARALELEQFICAHHPYATPEILMWQAMASDAYGQWVNHETNDN
jgi:periplasmic divalent cation tolerance protein